MSNRYGTEATPDRPEFAIRVSGSDAPRGVIGDVVEIDVAEEVGRHGRLSLLVQNWDPDTRTVRYSDSGPFTPGSAVQVQLGYHSELQEVFDGVVSAVTAHFPAGSSPVLQVEARSRSVLLDGRPRTRVLTESSDADLAAAIASDYGLTADAGSDPQRPAVTVDRVTDWEYLRGRAQQYGWALYVRGSTLVFRPPAQPGRDDPELEYGLNLTELRLTQDIAHAAGSSTVTGWDPEATEQVSAEAGPSQAGIDTGDRPDHAEAAQAADWPGRQDEVERSGVADAARADLLATGRQRREALAHLHGTGAVVGNPALRCDSWVRVAGAGERMSGPHYLSAVRHRLSARGYRTEFQLGLPPALLPPTGRQATGAPLVIGVVSDVDDPAGWGRVAVSFPWRADDTAVWARLATLDAGDGQGSWFVPDVGQEVLVGFVDGDAEQPYVLGSLWNGGKAPPLSMADGNPVRGLVTRSGHRLLFDDGDAATVTLRSADGSELVIDDEGDRITITHAGSGNAIAVSADGIELAAARGDIVLKAEAGDVTLDGIAIRGKSTGASSIESSAALELKSAGTLGIKGTLVQIN